MLLLKTFFSFIFLPISLHPNWFHSYLCFFHQMQVKSVSVFISALLLSLFLTLFQNWTINAGPISTHLHEMSALFIFSVQCGHLMTYRDVIVLTMCQLRLTSSCNNEFIIEFSIKADFLSVRSILGFYLNNSTCLLKV